MSALLELNEIRVCYGKAEALKGISLKIDERLIVTLIGANGAGKTTALRAISGLVGLMSGEIWLMGERINGLVASHIVKKGIAHVPEGRRLFPYMTVLDNMYMGAYLRRDTKKIKQDTEMIFSHFPRLKERLRQKAGSLSGGEQQMLAMARALMAAPKLILLDEPTTGLSPLLVTETTNIIKDINRTEQLGILLVEQNARIALTLAHRGYVLENGKVVMEDTAYNLVKNEDVKKAYLGG